MKHFPITVVQNNKDQEGELIGHSLGGKSPLANPYSAYPWRDRDAVNAMYREWLWKHIDKGTEPILDELDRLATIATERPLKLRCVCEQPTCHGDVIKEALEEALNQ